MFQRGKKVLLYVGLALLMLVTLTMWFGAHSTAYAASHVSQVRLDSIPTPDFSSGGTDSQSAQMTFVQNELTPYFLQALGSDKFNQLVGLVLSAHDYHECAVDLAAWGGTDGVDEPTDTSDACGGVLDDIESLVGGLLVQKAYSN